MKSTKKVLSLLLVIAMIFSLAIPAMAEETQTPDTLVSWSGGTSVTSNGENDVVKDVTLTMNDNGTGLNQYNSLGVTTSTYGNLSATPWYGTNNFSADNFGYMQFVLSTEGYEDLSVTMKVGNNGKAPASYVVSVSTDEGATWTAADGNLTAPDTKVNKEASAVTSTVALPEAAEDQASVIVRIAQASAAINANNAGALYVYTLAVTGTAVEDEDEGGDDMTGKAVILHSNDVHGSIAGYAYMAALKADFEAKGADVIVVDAGDYSQGTTYVSESKGANAIDLMNLVGYDYVTIGNHEFDYGYAQLVENMEDADFTVLCSDVLDENGDPIFDAYAIEDVNGVKIGFFGLETPEAQTKANPALIKGLTFLAGEELYANAQAQVDALKAAGADVVICLSHLGLDAESEPNRSADLLANVTGIDMLIDGHSHTVITATAEDPIQSTGTAFANIGVIVVDEATKAIEDNYLYAVPGDLTADETVAAAAQAIIDDIQAKYGAVFAKSEVELNGAKAPGNRTEETNLGDLITDAMVWQVMQNKDGLTVPEENVVAITNGGGIRASIGIGDVTMNDVNTVLPFGNTIAVVYVTGAELLEALEASTYCTPTAVGGFPQVAGMEFTIRTFNDYDANEETYPNSTYYGPASINRVTIESVNGQDFDPEATYAVITNNFCAGGGDTYYAFAAASSQFDTGVPLDEALISYITEELGGVIGEEYAEPQGRITVKTAEDYAGKTVILHSNDVHGAIKGYAYMAALKADYEAMGADVILVDAGDYSQGTTYVSDSKGANAIDLMNLVGYDFATIGNHEFDYGYAQLVENMEDAEFTVLCSDVLDENGDPIFDAYAIKEVNGVKIGFFGLETPEAQTKANPALIKGLTFLAGEELYANAQAQVDALKAEGADVIICLSHLGLDGESEPNRSEDLLANVTGLDMIIDAHSHTVITATADKPIQSTGTAFANIGVIVVDNETKAIEDNYLYAVPGDLTADADVAAAAQEIIDGIQEKYGAVFATSEVELNGAKAPDGNRDSETNLGDLITDAMVWQVMQNKDGLTVPEENVVAITNGGGIRAYIHEGEVTMNDVHTVLPFGNTIAVVYVTGAELLEALEASTYCTPGAVGGFPQVAGIEFTLNTGAEYDANAETYPASTYYGPASINRVTITSINGEDFDPEATYAVITNNFCAGGGDTYYAFAAASSQFDTGVPLDEALINYIEEELGGVIGDEYAEPQGRINIVDIPFSDVASSGYCAYICEAEELGIVNGYADGTFKPNANVTRAQFVTMLWRLAGEPEAENTTLTFKDAGDISAPYQAAVAWAVEQGIVKGYADNTFRPNAAINRGQMATFIYRYAVVEAGEEAPAALKESYGFVDEASFSSAYVDAINVIANCGIMNGINEAPTFDAAGTATRGMAATVLVRLYTLMYSAEQAA